MVYTTLFYQYIFFHIKVNEFIYLFFTFSKDAFNKGLFISDNKGHFYNAAKNIYVK